MIYCRQEQDGLIRGPREESPGGDGLYRVTAPPQTGAGRMEVWTDT